MKTTILAIAIAVVLTGCACGTTKKASPATLAALAIANVPGVTIEDVIGEVQNSQKAKAETKAVLQVLLTVYQRTAVP